MFPNEARIAATLHHPNVIEAYDFGSENGPYYLAMEYLGGRDTRRIVHGLARAGQKLPLEIAIAAAIGIATGLHYVHERLDKNGKVPGKPFMSWLAARRRVVHARFDVVGRRRANRFRSSTTSWHRSPEPCATRRRRRMS